MSTLLLSSMLLSGCAGYLPGAGPKTAAINQAGTAEGQHKIAVLNVDAAVNVALQQAEKKQQFSQIFNETPVTKYLIGAGDVLEVTIWEAPPASLFGSGAVDVRGAMGTSRAISLPDQMVGHEGFIRVPFAGIIQVAGRTQQQVEWSIVEQLKSKANQPQVLVRVKNNNSSNVTVVGEVANSKLVPLTSKGERLLDALAISGGVKQSVNKTTVQITRADKVATMPLSVVIQDPKQNVVLTSGDVITALNMPMSLTVLGATGKNEELNFETQGISLVQALGRSGGLQDQRADAQGVFLFRFEQAELAAQLGVHTTPAADGRVPVVYRLDLRDPAVFFHAQNFMVQDKDVLYVSNASAAELQKFLSVLVSAFYPILSVATATR